MHTILIAKMLQLVHQIHQDPAISQKVKQLAVQLETCIKQNKGTSQISTRSPYSQDRTNEIDCNEIYVEQFEFSSGEKQKISQGKQNKVFDNDDLFCDEVYESMDEMNMRKQIEKQKTNETLRPILATIKELPQEQNFLENRKKFTFERMEQKKYLKINTGQKKKRFCYLTITEEAPAIETFFKLRNNM